MYITSYEIKNGVGDSMLEASDVRTISQTTHVATFESPGVFFVAVGLLRSTVWSGCGTAHTRTLLQKFSTWKDVNFT